MTKNDDIQEEEDTRTEGERLRNTWFYGGKWHASNNAELPSHRGMLLDSLERWEDQIAERKAIKDGLQAKYDEALKELRTAANDLGEATLNADILKMALSDEMGIPK